MRTLYIDGFFVLGFALTMTPVLGPSPLRFSGSLMEPGRWTRHAPMILASRASGEGLSRFRRPAPSCENAATTVNAGINRAKERPGGNFRRARERDPCLGRRKSMPPARKPAGSGRQRPLE